MGRHLGLPQLGCLAATVVVCLALFIDAAPRPALHCHGQELLDGHAAASNSPRRDRSGTSNSQQPGATIPIYSHSTIIGTSGRGYRNGTVASFRVLDIGAASLDGGVISEYPGRVGLGSDGGAVHLIDSGERTTRQLHDALRKVTNRDQVNETTSRGKFNRSTSHGTKTAVQDHSSGLRRKQTQYTPPAVDRIANVLERYTSSTASSPVNPFEGLGKLAFISAVVCAFVLLPASGTSGEMRGAATSIGQASHHKVKLGRTSPISHPPGPDCRFSSRHLEN